MLSTFLSQVRDQVSKNIIRAIGQSNLIEEAMLYSASADSKMIRAALIFASGKINKSISDKSLLTLATAIDCFDGSGQIKINITGDSNNGGNSTEYIYLLTGADYSGNNINESIYGK